MADLTHKMENVLDEIRHGNIVVNADIIDVIFECIDNLRRWLQMCNKVEWAILM